MLIMSVIYPLTDTAICLGEKKSKLGKGYWNGFGGKKLPGESIEDCAIRELEEECGLIANRSHLRRIMVATIHRPTFSLILHAFFARRCRGEIQASEEMDPYWFRHETAPFCKMMPADRLWLPRTLAGERLRGVIRYGEDDEVIETYWRSVVPR